MKEGPLAHEGQQFLRCSRDRRCPDKRRQAADAQPRQFFAAPLDQELAAPGLIEGVAFEVEVLMENTGSLNVMGPVLHPVIRGQSGVERVSGASLLHTELVRHNIDKQAPKRE